MRAHPDEEQLEFLGKPSFLYFGIQVALLLLVLGLWIGREFDLLASSQAHVVWNTAISAPIDRTTPLMFDSREIVMRRTACEGVCPIYEVRIRSDGLVRFQGTHFVCAVGERTASADAFAVRHLMRAIEAVKFGQIPVHRDWIIDVPVTTLTLVSEQSRTGVAFQDRDDDALIEMRERVDEVAGTRRWLPTRRGRSGYCPNDDGTLRQIY